MGFISFTDEGRVGVGSGGKKRCRGDGWLMTAVGVCEGGIGEEKVGDPVKKFFGNAAPPKLDGTGTTVEHFLVFASRGIAELREEKALEVSNTRTFCLDPSEL